MAENEAPGGTENEEEDLWAAALQEQAAAEAAAMAQTDSASSTEATEEDPWAAALQEQASLEAAQAGASSDGFDTASGTGQLVAQYTPSTPAGLQNRDLEIILDIPTELTVELGRTKISIRNLLQLGHGSVIELDAIAGEPMNVYVNGVLLAQGEVVVVQDKFGVRITDILTPAERIKRLQK